MWYYVGQVYNITYFDSVPLSFVSSMMLIMAGTTWIASRELGLLVQVEARETEDFRSLLLDRFSVVTTIGLLPTLVLSGTNPFINFSTLFLALMIVPVVYPMVELPRLRRLKAVLERLGLLPKLTVLGIVGFLVAYRYGPIHPIMLVAVLGSFLTSFSSSMGEAESKYVDLESIARLWKSAFWRVSAVLSPVPFWIFFMVTWWFSHLSIIIGC